MPVHLSLSPRSRFIVSAAIALSASTAACSAGRTADVPDASAPTKGDAGSSPGPDSGAAPDSAAIPDAGAPAIDCGAPSVPLPTYATAASGPIEGSGVGASLCNAAAYVFLSEYTTPKGDYLLFIDSSQASAFAFDAPADASGGIFGATLLITGPNPGTYASSGASTCGFMTFSYSLPVPPGVDCDGGVGPDCPAGCSSVCSGQGCEPCTPQQPGVGFGAAAATDCLGESQTVLGSWTATLTSVDPAGSEQNGMYWRAHGTLQATLVNDGGDAGAASVNVSLAF